MTASQQPGFGTGAQHSGQDEPVAVLQWKGTDACLDLECPTCGHHGHFDGYFAQTLFCPGCGTVFRLASEVRLTVLPERTPEAKPLILD